MKESVGNPLHLKSVNHISLICRSVEESMDFYQNVLGFFPIRRPGSFNFDGAWYYLFIYLFFFLEIKFFLLILYMKFDFCVWSNLICRLFGFGIGIHLLEAENPEKLPKKTEINPKDNHISFQVNIFSKIYIIVC